jgi:hypothetical protein
MPQKMGERVEKRGRGDLFLDFNKIIFSFLFLLFYFMIEEEL